MGHKSLWGWSGSLLPHIIESCSFSRLPQVYCATYFFNPVVEIEGKSFLAVFVVIVNFVLVRFIPSACTLDSRPQKCLIS